MRRDSSLYLLPLSLPLLPRLFAERLQSRHRHRRRHHLRHREMVGTRSTRSGLPVTKDPQVCDPDSNKTADLERLDHRTSRRRRQYRRLSQEHLQRKSHGPARTAAPSRPENLPLHSAHPSGAGKGPLDMMSSDATLHTVHMEGAATYNLPFPFADRVTTRTMPTPGLVHLRCNGGHVWMNAEMMVVTHPYYAVTDESGNFRIHRRAAGNLSDRGLARRLGTRRKEQALRCAYRTQRATSCFHRARSGKSQ